MSAQSKETTQSEIRDLSNELDRLNESIGSMRGYLADAWHRLLISMEQSWLGPVMDELGEGFRISRREDPQGWDIETKVDDNWVRVVHHIQELNNPREQVAYIETLQEKLIAPYCELLLARLRGMIRFAEKDLDELTKLKDLGQKLRDQFPK